MNDSVCAEQLEGRRESTLFTRIYRDEKGVCSTRLACEPAVQRACFDDVALFALANFSTRLKTRS